MIFVNMICKLCQNGPVEQTSQRAGAYVKQPTGYRAFIPNPLPPDPPLALTNELVKRLESAMSSLGRLDGVSLILPNPDLFVSAYLRKEAVLSSQIEGTQASLAEIMLVEQSKARVQSSDVGDVLNYVKALNYGLERLETLPVSNRLLCEIHARLMEGTRGGERTPGEIRTSQNWIGAAGARLNTATFVPPPPSELRQSMSDLEKFIHSASDMPILILIGLAHAQFETIHPFLDGNGRLGRLLITFLLQERRVISKPLLYPSLYLKQHRETYYNSLQAVRDHGAWEQWIAFFLEAVRVSADNAFSRANEIVRLREMLRERAGGSSGWALNLLDQLFENPYIAAILISIRFGVSAPTANRWIAVFESLGILKQVGSAKRNRVFVFQEFMDLLEAD